MLIQMWDRLGPFPRGLIESWPRYSRYYNTEGARISCETDPDRDYRADRLCLYKDESKPLNVEFATLSDRWRECRPKKMSDECFNELLALADYIFEYTPEKRPSAIKLLEHPYFSGEHL